MLAPLAALIGICGAGQVLSSSTTSSAPLESDLVWRSSWRDFSTPEYIVLSATLVAEAIAFLAVPGPESANFRGGILFDDAVRDGLRPSARSGRDLAGGISDALYIVMGAYPIVVDAILVTWGLRGKSDLGFKLALIDLESLTTTALFALVAVKATGRERPFGLECERDPGYHPGCSTPNRYRSFTSGHTAIAVTGAALICTHHVHLPLYGGGLADGAACAGAIGLAGLTGVLRIVADVHYATDVLAGATIGVLAGYLLPLILHYGFSDSEPETAARISVIADGQTIGLRLLGSF